MTYKVQTSLLFAYKFQIWLSKEEVGKLDNLAESLALLFRLGTVHCLT